MAFLYNYKHTINYTKFSLFKLQKVNKIVSRSMKSTAEVVVKEGKKVVDKTLSTQASNIQQPGKSTSTPNTPKVPKNQPSEKIESTTASKSSSAFDNYTGPLQSQESIKDKLPGSEISRSTTHTTVPLDTITIQPREYATYNIHTPVPSTSNEESLKNNPPVTLYRKKGSKTIQHAEVVEEKCTTPNCSNKLCNTLCGESTGAKAIAHVGHSEKHNTLNISETDIDGKKETQYMTPYETPHNVESQSAHPEIDEERSRKLLEMLKKIQENGQQDDGSKT